MAVFSQLKQGALQFGLSLSDLQIQTFEQYRQELLAWNQKVNLTRIIDPEEIAVKHFLDSLSIMVAWPENTSQPTLIDVGSGAGFPGVPLKIGRPETSVTLLESTAKKTKFLKHLIDSLRLTEITVVTARAEEAGRQVEHRERYDLAVARAVSTLAVLAEYTLPLVKVGGRVIAQKGQRPVTEVKAAKAAVEKLGGQVTAVLSVEVPGLQAERHLIVIDKVKPTPRPYPRRPGIPARAPIS